MTCLKKLLQNFTQWKTARPQEKYREDDMLLTLLFPTAHSPALPHDDHATAPGVPQPKVITKDHCKNQEPQKERCRVRGSPNYVIMERADADHVTFLKLRRPF